MFDYTDYRTEASWNYKKMLCAMYVFGYHKWNGIGFKGKKWIAFYISFIN